MSPMTQASMDAYHSSHNASAHIFGFHVGDEFSMFLFHVEDQHDAHQSHQLHLQHNDSTMSIHAG